MAKTAKNNSKKCAYIGDMNRRSWMKSLTWRIIGIFILGAITWIFTRDWEQTSIITIIFHSIRFALFFFHERVWENVEWGRIKATEEMSSGDGI